MLVTKVHEYGAPNLTNPNEGAKPIRDTSGKIVAYVALSVDAMNEKGQIAEIPVVLYSADGKKIIVFDSVHNVIWKEALTVKQINQQVSGAIYNTLTAAEKALYDDPHKWSASSTTDKKPKLGMGDKISIDYLRKGYKSFAQGIYDLNEALGITLSDLNDPERFAKYLQTGDLTFLNDDDLILIMLFPDGVRIIEDAVNQ